MVKNPLPMQETWVQPLGPEYSSGEANGNLLQYSCLGNPVNREAQQAVVYGVVKESNMTQWTAKKLDFQPGTFWLSQLKQEALPPSSGYRPGMLPSTGQQIMMGPSSVQFSPVQWLSPVRLLGTSWTTAHQASLSVTNSWSLLKLMSIESVMSSNHLILCHPLLPLPSIFPSIRVFSNESVLHIRWPKYWSFSFSISPSNEYSGLISFRMDWFDLLAVQGDVHSAQTEV